MSDFLRGKRRKSPQLAEMVRGPEPILAPGAYDALSARMIEQAGFPAVYMTGVRHFGIFARPARCWLADDVADGG